MSKPETARIAAPFEATSKQLAVAHAWHDPLARIVTVGGAIRSGKTQAAGRLLVETAVEQPATYLVARSTWIPQMALLIWTLIVSGAMLARPGIAMQGATAPTA